MLDAGCDAPLIAVSYTHLIGVNSIVDVIEEEDTEDFERMAALVPSEDGYAASSVWALAWHRLPWLLILMASSVLCAKLKMCIRDSPQHRGSQRDLRCGAEVLNL